MANPNFKTPSTHELAKSVLNELKERTKYIVPLSFASEAVQLAVVQHFGFSIELIDNPSDAVQLAAVQDDAYNISYMQNPTESVQLFAIRNSCCYSLRLINLQIMQNE